MNVGFGDNMHEILDNRSRGNVGEFLKAEIKKNAKLSIVSAYFTIFAYGELKKELNKISELRFLFGEPTFLKSDDSKELKEFKIEKKEREEALYGTGIEIKLKNTLTQKSISKECANWIKNKAQIKSLIKPDFLHGKAYIIDNPGGDDTAIVGSSNFTVSGLGLKPNSNMELNLLSKNNDTVRELTKWFDEIWENEDMVEDVKEQVLQQIQVLYAENSPEFLYFLTLYNIFKSFLDEMDDENILKESTGIKETEIWNMLYNFQYDAAVGAINKLEKYGGCIIADSVGLGKTFEALAIIKYYELRNYRVLVLAPKKLRENWTIYVGNDINNILAKDRFSYNVLNHTDLSRESGKTGDIDLATLNWGNYDLLVIDESHNFRNNPPTKDRKTRYAKLMEDIIKAGVKTKVLMLSATPVNNRLNDLKNQIAFIIEGDDKALKDPVGIKSIDMTLREAQRRFNVWSELPKKDRTTERLLDSLNYDYFNLLSTLTIARSRKHIRKYYDNHNTIKFPTRLAPMTLKPNIDNKNEFPNIKTVNQIIEKLYLTIYSPLSCVKPEKKKEYSDKYDMHVRGGAGLLRQVDREAGLINLMRTNLLKRLESSVNSFYLSVDRIIKDIEKMLLAMDIEQDDYMDDLSINDIDIDDDELQDFFIGNKIKVLIKDLDHIKIKQRLNYDKERLLLLLEESKKINPKRDAKLQNLKEIIREKIQNPINNNNKKVLIFTAYADTARYLYDEISPWVKEEFGLYAAEVNGSKNCRTTLNGIKSDYSSILTNFSPISKERKNISSDLKEEIDVLIATDCISEGQNLQDCDCLINYDIHWNPVRIIQRFGRIDRLGSINSKVQLVNFWPNVEIDEYIRLERRVKAKMTMMDISATGEENLIEETDRDLMNDLEYRRKQLEQLQKEVLDLEDLSGSISITDLTLDDFKMDLWKFNKANPGLLEHSPTGLHALVGRKAKIVDEVDPGVVFCLKHIGKEHKVRETNSLHPYYLIYINSDGSIKFAHTNSKKILDIYRALCSGEKDIWNSLCDDFNKETKEGSQMSKYTELLEKVIESIVGITEEKGLESLFRLGGTRILDNTIRGLDDFELISFLIVK